MPTHKIAVIGGDGIGTEVVEAGVKVLEALAALEPDLAFDFERFDWGSDYYRRTGRMMAEDGLEKIKNADAIYFGSVGDPDLPDDITLWGLRLAICQGFDQYANVRPTRLLPGLTGPLRPELGSQIDWVIVRENSEGEYAGVGPGAHGRLVTAEGRMAHSTEKRPEVWLEQVEANGQALVEDERLGEEAQGDEYLLMGLRLGEGIDPAVFKALAGRELNARRVASLIGEKLLMERADGRLAATPDGALLLDAVVADLAA